MKGESMDEKKSIAARTADGRRGFMKMAGVSGGLALAASSSKVLAATGAWPDTCCSLAPYFEVAEGKLDQFKALGPKFVELTRQEKGCLYYSFSFSGQAAHCREGYKDAAALLAHLKNVDAVLKEALAISKITRLEVHGPAAQLEILRGPLAGLNPQYFTLAGDGFRR
jgi:quinol monooxygenase YgiN